MSLYQSGDVQMTLLAFDGGEGVSEEHYPGDTMYLLAEGKMTLKIGSAKHRMEQGQVFMVPAGALHSLRDSLQAPANHGKAVTYQEADYEVYHKTWRNQDGKTD